MTGPYGDDLPGAPPYRPPSPGAGFPPAGFPPPGVGVPPPGAGYAPVGPGFPPVGPGFPPAGPGYAPAGFPPPGAYGPGRAYGPGPGFPPGGYGAGPGHPGFVPPIPTPTGLTLLTAPQLVLRKYAVFSGRATRSEFWWFVLAYVIVFLGTSMAGAAFEGAGMRRASDLLGMTLMLLIFALLVPTLAVTVRRLHDVGMSGAMVLIALVPFFGSIALIIICAQRSKPGHNQYGLAPQPVELY